MQISIVLPTLNEAAYLPVALRTLAAQAAGEVLEVLVADCGSRDGTVDRAREEGAQVIEGGFGSRAAALNAGAAAARGEVFFFLDADCRVPAGWDAAIRRALADPRVVGGAFSFRLDGPERGLRVVEWVNHLRYTLSQAYYGDQGIFVRAEAFHRLGGYPVQPILESADFCGRLKGIGRLVLLRDPVLSSPRRFLTGGIYRVLARDTHIWWRHYRGRPVAELAAAYWAENREGRYQ